MSKLRQKTDALGRKIRKFFHPVIVAYSAIENTFRVIGSVLMRLRKPAMAIPVVLAALYLAQQNIRRLPEQVGINLQTTGEFAYTISRELAVVFPLGITGFCLLLMFMSRKTVYPWVISIFSLVIPYLLYLTNIFPG